MIDPPTRNQAHAYLNHLRDIRGDFCIESCVHSVATNTAEHCLEARASGELMTAAEHRDGELQEYRRDWDGSEYPSVMRSLLRHVRWETIAEHLMSTMAMSYDPEYVLEGGDVEGAWEFEIDNFVDAALGVSDE